MTLTIEIPCNSGIEMETNLNKAIASFGDALREKGFSPMELEAFDESIENCIYKLKLE